MSKRLAIALGALSTGAFAVVVAGGHRWTPAAVCGPETGVPLRVVVDTGTHALSLCRGGSAVGTYRVRIGREGTGKTREGDGRTPLGRYALGAPRPSTLFGTFVPVGYPTDEQRRLGLTGSAVGVHGPPRRARFLGAWLNAFDITDGCIGIASDDEMTEIASWIRQHAVPVIEIR